MHPRPVFGLCEICRESKMGLICAITAVLSLVRVCGPAEQVTWAARPVNCGPLLSASHASVPFGAESAIVEAWSELLTKDRVLSGSECTWLVAIEGGADPFAPRRDLFDWAIFEGLEDLDRSVKALADQGRVNGGILRSLLLAQSRKLLGQSEEVTRVQNQAQENRADLDQWSEILRDPKRREAGILDLVRLGKWDVFAGALDLEGLGSDQEFLRSLGKLLGKVHPAGDKAEFDREVAILIRSLIEKANAETLACLAMDFFSQPGSAEMKDQLALVIEKGGQDTLQALAWKAFSQPHAAQWTELLGDVVERSNQDTLRWLAQFTFSKPHMANADLLLLLIEKADQKSLASLARHTFSQSHAAAMTDVLRLVVEKADAETLGALARFTFSKQHVHAPDFEILRETIDIPDPEERRRFLLRAFGPAKGRPGCAVRSGKS